MTEKGKENMPEIASKTAEELKAMRAEHRVLAEYRYEPTEVVKGYSNQTLYINLDDNTIQARAVTDQMKEIFVGGRGFGLWLLWNAVTGHTKWDDPENEIVISSGPLGGTTTFPGSGKSLCVSLSPLTDSVMDSNVGGYFGPLLKFAGWDAIEIQGKAEKGVIVFIDGNTGRVTIEEAPGASVDSYPVGEEVLGMFAEDESEKRDISSVSAGTGADHSLFGCLNFSWYDTDRLSGQGTEGASGQESRRERAVQPAGRSQARPEGRSQDAPRDL
jgi:aldehyde:ferredoxin oxidoreductase